MLSAPAQEQPGMPCLQDTFCVHVRRPSYNSKIEIASLFLKCYNKAEQNISITDNDHLKRPGHFFTNRLNFDRRCRRIIRMDINTPYALLADKHLY